MRDLERAVNEYLRALDMRRAEYVPSARNAPSVKEARGLQDARLAEAERRLREAAGA